MAWQHFAFLASKFWVRSIFVSWLKSSSFSKLVFSNMPIVRREIFKPSFRDGLYTYQKWALQSRGPFQYKNEKILTPKRQTKKFQQPIATTWNKPESMVWRSSFETRMFSWINDSILCLRYQTRVLATMFLSVDVGTGERGSRWGGSFYGYRLKFRLFYGYRLIFSSYG